MAQTALPSDKTYKNQLHAGAILEPLFKDQPDHPGLAHYLIHTYDIPALAPKALDAATRYAKIAPSAPHALHMPSHTFTRVGSWQESVDTNIASAERGREKAVAEELHAMDYQVYAYLQTGQDRAAREVVEKVPALAPRIAAAPVNAAPPVAGYYALAAIPARYALERGAWDEAAALTPISTAFLYSDSLTYFARAIGAARAGRPAAAAEDVARLTALREGLLQKNDAYWAQQVDIQRRAAEAWIAFAEGKVDQALTAMRAAADLEDTTEKSSVSPGPLTPAREQLGDMLLASKRPAEALEAYRGLDRERAESVPWPGWRPSRRGPGRPAGRCSALRRGACSTSARRPTRPAARHSPKCASPRRSSRSLLLLLLRLQLLLVVGIRSAARALRSPTAGSASSARKPPAQRWA